MLLTDDIALAAAASFTTVALMSLLYTGYTYVWRVKKIRFVLLIPHRFDLLADPSHVTGIARPSTTTTGSGLASFAVSCCWLSLSTSR